MTVDYISNHALANAYRYVISVAYTARERFVLRYRLMTWLTLKCDGPELQTSVHLGARLSVIR